MMACVLHGTKCEQGLGLPRATKSLSAFTEMGRNDCPLSGKVIRHLMCYRSAGDSSSHGQMLNTGHENTGVRKSPHNLLVFH